MPVKFVNDLQLTIATVGGISASDTTVDVEAGEGALLVAQVPDLGSNGVVVRATFKDDSGNRETVEISARSVDQLTLAQRAVEVNDTARAWVQGDILDFCLSKSLAEDAADQRQIDKTSNYTVTADDLRGHTLLTNYGATGEVINTLPVITQHGRNCLDVCVAAAQYLRLTATGGASFRMGEVTGGANGYVRSNQVGTYFRIQGVYGLNQWVISPDGVFLLADE